MKKKWQKPELKKQIFVEHEKLISIGSCTAWGGEQTGCTVDSLGNPVGPCDCPSNPFCYIEPSTGSWNSAAS